MAVNNINDAPERTPNGLPIHRGKDVPSRTHFLVSSSRVPLRTYLRRRHVPSPSNRGPFRHHVICRWVLHHQGTRCDANAGLYVAAYRNRHMLNHRAYRKPLGTLVPPSTVYPHKRVLSSPSFSASAGHRTSPRPICIKRLHTVWPSRHRSLGRFSIGIDECRRQTPLRLRQTDRIVTVILYMTRPTPHSLRLPHTRLWRIDKCLQVLPTGFQTLVAQLGHWATPPGRSR